MRCCAQTVEREFEIIGEALAHLARVDEVTASRIGEYRRIIAVRNILVHGYADVDERLVWDIIETKLPALRGEVVAHVEGRDCSQGVHADSRWAESEAVALPLS